MNILVVSSWCPYPADNGSRLRIYHVMAQLARREHRLTLIALAQEDSDLGAARQGLEPLCRGGVTLFPSRFFRPNTVQSWLGFFSPKPRMLLDTYHREAAAEIARRCRSGEYAAVLAMELGVAHYIPRDMPSPCLLDQVEVSGFLKAWRGARSLPKRLRLRLMLIKLRAHLSGLAPRYAAWAAVSEEEAQAIVRLLGEHAAPPVVVLTNGVDLEANDYLPGAAYDPDRLIYSGALSYPANLDAVRYFAGEILPLIRQSRPQARLYVTGRADALTADDPLRHDPAVVLTGYLDDIRPALRGAAACVVPLRQGSGTRLKILEAMALGTPVVATSCGAEGIAAAAGEHLLIADAPAAFADAAMRVMQDAELRARLGAAGRCLVEARYGWDTVGAQLETLLAGLAPPAESKMRETVCP